MKRAIGAPTLEQQRRQDAIREVGCVACWMDGRGRMPAEVHHLTLGGRHGAPQLGHDRVVGLCTWHHRGNPPDGYTYTRALEVFGPSFGRQPNAFRLHYGRQEVLEEFQDALLVKHAEVTGIRPVSSRT